MQHDSARLIVSGFISSYFTCREKKSKALLELQGKWSAECGVRSAECGVRSPESGVRSAECPLWKDETYRKAFKLNMSPPRARFRGQWGRVLPYIGYIGMCGSKRYGFFAVLVINRVYILADAGHFGHN